MERGEADRLAAHVFLNNAMHAKSVVPVSDARLADFGLLEDAEAPAMLSYHVSRLYMRKHGALRPSFGTRDVGSSTWWLAIFFNEDVGACAPLQPCLPVNVIAVSHFLRTDGSCHHPTLLVPPTARSVLAPGAMVGASGVPPPPLDAPRRDLLFFRGGVYVPRGSTWKGNACDPPVAPKPYALPLMNAKAQESQKVRLAVACAFADAADVSMTLDPTQRVVSVGTTSATSRRSSTAPRSMLTAVFCLEMGGLVGYGVRWVQALEAGCVPVMLLPRDVELIPRWLAPLTEIGMELATRSSVPPMALRVDVTSAANSAAIAKSLLVRLRLLAANASWISGARAAGAAALQRARWDGGAGCNGAYNHTVRELVKMRDHATYRTRQARPGVALRSASGCHGIPGGGTVGGR